MTSVTLENAHPAVDAVLECLSVRSEADYEAIRDRFALGSAMVQASERVDRWRSMGRDFNSANPKHTMLCLRVVDDQGNLIEDYDVAFTAGEEASPDLLPQGFFRDRQRNQKHPGRLTYYLDHEKLSTVPVGFEVNARPTEGLVRYQKASIRPQAMGAILRPNETMLVEIVLRRLVDRNCFQLTEDRAPGDISGEASGVSC